MRRGQRLAAAAVLTLVLALGACVGSTTPTSTGTGLFVSPTSVVISVGATQQISVAMLPPDLVPGGLSAVHWSSSNTAVATVSDAGVVKGVAAGNATVVASAGQYFATAQIRVLAP